MARPIYPHELTDPDFQWLLNSYRENRPGVALVDSTCLPLVMVKIEEDETVIEEALETEIPPPVLPLASEETPILDHGKKEL